MMYNVTLEGKTVVWNRHADQLRIRSVTLPTLNFSDNSNSDSNSDSTSFPISQNNHQPRHCDDLQESANLGYPGALHLKREQM